MKNLKNNKLKSNKTNFDLDLSKTVMAKIEKENITMRSKYYFITVSIVSLITLILIILISLFLTNIVIFKLRIYDPAGFLLLGKLGLEAFMGSIPWLLSMATIMIFSFATIFIRRYDISYQRSYSSLIMGMLFFVIIGAIMVDKTEINENLKRSEKIPVLYTGTYLSDKWVMGEIVEVDNKNKQMIVHIPYKEINVALKWKTSTQMPTGSSFKEHDYIKAVGHQENNVFIADGIVIR